MGTTDTEGDGEQIGGAFALLPERGAVWGRRRAGGAARGGGFAEFCGEERGGAELAHDDVGDVIGIGEK